MLDHEFDFVFSFKQYDVEARAVVSEFPTRVTSLQILSVEDIDSGNYLGSDFRFLSLEEFAQMTMVACLCAVAAWKRP
jgi:hypothetical protein